MFRPIPILRRRSIRWTAAAVLCLALALAATATAQHSGSVEDSPEGLMQQGMSNFSSGNYERSVEFLNQLVEVFGREPELRAQVDLAMYARSCAYYNLADYPKAIETFEEYIKQFPESKFVDEALFRIGTAQQIQEEYDAAITAYQKLRSSYPRSSFAEDALYQTGICRLIQEQSDLAAAAFGDFMNLYTNSPLWGQAGAFRARSLLDNGKGKEAIELLEQMGERQLSWTVVTYCNFLAFEIGDAMFDETEYELALKAYRRVKPRQALLRHQQQYVRQLEERVRILSSARVNPREIQSRFQEERRLGNELQQATEMLNQLENLPDYDANLYHRIGRCFFNTDRYWEARVAFTRVVATSTDEAVAEAGHFDLILALSRLRRFNDLLIEADAYLTTYDPGGHW